jgi:hypothetical protein
VLRAAHVKPTATTNHNIGRGTPGAFTMAPENQVRSYHLSGHLEAHLEIGAPLVTHLNSDLAIEIDGSQFVSATTRLSHERCLGALELP